MCVCVFVHMRVCVCACCLCGYSDKEGGRVVIQCSYVDVRIYVVICFSCSIIIMFFGRCRTPSILCVCVCVCAVCVVCVCGVCCVLCECMWAIHYWW